MEINLTIFFYWFHEMAAPTFLYNFCSMHYSEDLGITSGCFIRLFFLKKKKERKSFIFKNYSVLFFLSPKKTIPKKLAKLEAEFYSALIVFWFLNHLWKTQCLPGKIEIENSWDRKMREKINFGMWKIRSIIKEAMKQNHFWSSWSKCSALMCKLACGVLAHWKGNK